MNQPSSLTKVTAKVLAGSAAGMLGIGLLAGPVAAQTSDIDAGRKADNVGSATFDRSDADVLSIDIAIAGGMDETHVCLSDVAFERRMPPGSCPFAHTGLAGATTDRYEIDLDPTLAAGTVHVQLHVATSDGETAYAGHIDGQPFYGNVAVAAAENTDESVETSDTPEDESSRDGDSCFVSVGDCGEADTESEASNTDDSDESDSETAPEPAVDAAGSGGEGSDDISRDTAAPGRLEVLDTTEARDAAQPVAVQAAGLEAELVSAAQPELARTGMTETLLIFAIGALLAGWGFLDMQKGIRVDD